jgi:hydrogenase/urease accessory protein HupE
MTRSLFCLLVMFMVTITGVRVHAHESQPGTLDLRQVDRDRYEVTWRAPTYFGKPHPASIELPVEWKTVVEPTVRTLSDSQLFRRVVTVGSQGVEGCIIRFPGLANTITDVFVRLNRLDGTTMKAVVRPTKPYAQLRGERTWYTTAGDFIALGFHHILKGFDHLLFVLGLMLIVKGRMMLLKTVTAFTVAHSITLALAALGYATLPLQPIDASIALSILFLGPEIVRSWRGETSLTIHYPWVVAFLFGLLHGFGFASGIITTGMPKADIPLSLLFFNVGVEAGQLTFVCTALTLLKLFKVLHVRWPRWVELVPGYTVGSLGAFWTIQRTIMLLSI